MSRLPDPAKSLRHKFFSPCFVNVDCIIKQYTGMCIKIDW